MIKYSHNVAVGRCERCGVEYRSANAREMHEAYHWRRGDGSCSMCNFGFELGTHVEPQARVN